MSYCRWSSNNWNCDVYCYEHVDNCYATHIAGRKREGIENITKLPPIDIGNFDAWHIAKEKQNSELENYPLVEIGLPYDGESFYDPTLEDMRERLIELKNLGYAVPDFVFNEIEDELTELNVPNDGGSDE
jgi:hypothetical protein